MPTTNPQSAGRRSVTTAIDAAVQVAVPRRLAQVSMRNVGKEPGVEAVTASR